MSALYEQIRSVHGEIIVKCRFGEDIRRISISQIPTYDDLCIMMHRIFKGTLPNSTDLKLKYTDSEGDLINLEDDADVNLAITKNQLKITVYNNHFTPSNGTKAAVIPDDLKTQLVTLRDTLSNLIQSLEQKDLSEPTVERSLEDKVRKLSTKELDGFLPQSDYPPPSQTTPDSTTANYSPSAVSSHNTHMQESYRPLAPQTPQSRPPPQQTYSPASYLPPPSHQQPQQQRPPQPPPLQQPYMSQTSELRPQLQQYPHPPPYNQQIPSQAGPQNRPSMPVYPQQYHHVQ